MEHLLFTLNVILPIILLILLGYVLKRIKFMKEDFIARDFEYIYKRNKDNQIKLTGLPRYDNLKNNNKYE